MQGRGVTRHRGLELQVGTRGHDGHTVLGDGAAEHDDVAGARAVGGDRPRVLDHADAGGGDETAVGLAAVDDLGVSGHDRDIGRLRRLPHRGHDAIEIGEREALLEDERGGQVERARAGHREIVHGAVDREVADVAAGEEQRRDDIRVRGEREPDPADGDHGLVVALVEDLVAERGKKAAREQLGRHLPAAAVSEQDAVAVAEREGTTRERHLRRGPRGPDPTRCDRARRASPGCDGC